ncbi:MAG: GNAT family N-acetyltransferase [Ginsengibacter sp.]
MSKYHIQKIGPQNFEMLVPLMKNCFGMEVSIDYFHWKYIQNPAGSFIGFVAIETETNEVGAYYGVIPQKFIVDGCEKTMYQSCDTMTHSNHRRQGLFKLLAEECYRFLKENNELFVIGFGGAQSTPGFLKFGWKHIFDLKYYFKPAFLCRISISSFVDEHNFVQHNDVVKLENFLEKINYDQEVIISKRSAAHMKWRTQNPNYFYKTVCYCPGETIEGYVIYYVLNNKLILFDFLFFSAKAEKALFGFLSRQVNKNNYKGIISFCQEKGRQAALLRKNDFISNPFKKGPLAEKTPFIFFGDELILNKYSSPLKWEITSYDHDAL